MSSTGPANAQAQALLQTLRKFILPLIQAIVGQATDLNNICFGIEADEFVIELEKFISGMITRSQPCNQDTAIEARLGINSFYHSQEDEVTMSANSNDRGNPEYNGMDQNMIPYQAGPQTMPLGRDEAALGKNLQILRKYVTQTMPNRLLCFEPHNSKLKISLFERADIYNHLSLKLRATRDSALISNFNMFVGYWRPAQYAILSHTWNQTAGELTYGDWKGGSLDATQPKCRKVVNFCKAAWEYHGLTLGWIDTVCINKESSAELDESIRSMYAWYENAQVCITYLATTNTLSDMHNDPWFTRGWTLQELVAPQRIKFYSKGWKKLSSKSNDKEDLSIQAVVRRATTIVPRELQNIRVTSISRRMQLVAKREVTRGEDIAYCLMGIFDVSVSTAYGEGAERAFFRLVEEIFRSTKNVSDIFNWAGVRNPYSRRYITSLFPSHPADYLNRSSNKQLRPWRPIEPLTLTHLGLRTPILLMPAVPLRESVSPYPPPIGDYHATVTIAPLRNFFTPLLNLSDNYLLLDKRVSGPEGVQEVQINRNHGVKVTLAFGTLNVEEQGSNIYIPKTCLAVLLIQDTKCSTAGYEKISTEDPIVFDLEKIGNINEDKHYYRVERSKLVTHGMQLVTLYL